MGDTSRGQKMDQLVYDAYDSFAPSEDARNRVLESLRSASQGVPEARPSRRFRMWWVAMPLAACLALVAIVVSVRPTAPAEQSKEVANSVVAEDVAGEAYEADAATEDMAAEGEGRPLEVTLGDGTAFAVGDELTDEPTYSELEGAEADGRPCVVADRAYVRFEGEDTWYELVGE